MVMRGLQHAMVWRAIAGAGSLALQFGAGGEERRRDVDALAGSVSGARYSSDMKG
jgi:hypothetical protein